MSQTSHRPGNPCLWPRMASLLAPMVALAALCGCGHCPSPPSLQARCVDFGCTAMTLNETRTAAVFETRDALILLRSGTAHRLAYAEHPCLKDAHRNTSILLLAPDGWRAIVYGTRSNIAFDLWGHSGRHVSIACVADFERRAVRPLEGFLPGSLRERSAEHHWGASGRFFYQWAVRDALDLEVMDLAGRRTIALSVLPKAQVHRCTLREVPEGLLVACATHRYPSGAKTTERYDQELLVQRFDLKAWPPTPGPVARTPVPGYGSPGGLRISRTGRYLAHFGVSDVAGEGKFLVWYRSHYGVVDLRTGRHRFLRTEEAERRRVLALEPNEQEDGLLLAELVTRGARSSSRGALSGTRVTRLGLDGTPGRAHELPWIVQRLYAMPGSAAIWAVGGCEARRLP